MKKIKSYYSAGKEWVLEKWHGSVMDRFPVSCIACIVLFLLLIIISKL